VLQAIGIGLLVTFGLYALIERGRADREKVWAGMAREAAHQLGTPLSAMAGWLELLRDMVTTTTASRAVEAMEQDLPKISAALVIASRNDKIVGAPDPALLPPGWTVLFMDQTGHMPHMEAAADVIAALQKQMA
jgi:signal transduction histidine kinase